MNWKTFFQNNRNRNEFIFTVLVCAPLVLLFSQLLLFIEQRDGVILNDPVLNLFQPIDFTWLTFALIYVAIILFLINIIKEPYQLMLAFQAYALMVLFRGIAMYLTPFDAPEKIILLHDPFVQLFGDGRILTKDLFFSGHTATMFLLFLLSDNKKLKAVFLIATILVGSAVLLQHVHYTVDVFVAPFVAYGSYTIIKKIHSKRNPQKV